MASSQTLMTDIRRALSTGRQAHGRGDSLRLGELLHALGPSSAATAALVLAVPFVWPLSLGPITTPFSILITFIGWQLVRGREQFPIPAKYLAIPVPRVIFRLMRRIVATLARRGRWHRIVVEEVPTNDRAADPFRRACAWGIVAGALLLMVPIPMLPLTNTFSALAIIAFAIAWMLRSRRQFTLGVIWCVITVVYFALLAGLVIYLGKEGLTSFGFAGSGDSK